jgi:hypothetical protein
VCARVRACVRACVRAHTCILVSVCRPGVQEGGRVFQPVRSGKERSGSQ